MHNLSNTWPYNPDGHLQNLTGSNDSSHLSYATLVFPPGMMPTPWTWSLVSYLISAAIAFGSYAGFMKTGEHGEPEDRPLLSYCRIPGILFNVGRLIPLLITSVKNDPTQVLKASTSVSALAIAFINNTFDWRSQVDIYSYIANISATLIFGLLVYQCNVIDITRHDELIYSQTLANKLNYGAVALVGGHCPQVKLPGQGCQIANWTGCPDDSSPQLVSHDPYLVGPQQVNLYSIWLIGFCLLTTWGLLAMMAHRHLTNSYQYSNIGEENPYAVSFLEQEFFRTAAAFYLVMLPMLGICLWSKGSFTFIDGVPEPGVDFNHTTSYSNISTWTDCFNVLEPYDTWAFTNLWIEQEWNKTWSEKLALFALM